MDWKNRMDQIKNKIKTQLNAKGVDNLLQIQAVFDVSRTTNRMKHFLNLKIGIR